MATLLTVRTALGQLARQPMAWLCAAVLSSGWWLLEVFMPLGVATGSLHRSTAQYELGFLGGAIAQAMAIGICLKMRWMVNLRSPTWGMVSDMTVLMVAAIAMGAFILVPAEVFQVWQFTEFRTAEAAVALLLGWAHLAAMICVIPLRWPRSKESAAFRDNAAGVAWIAFAAVLVPASFTGASPFSRAALHVLDPGRMLRITFDPTSLSGGTWLAALLPVIGWGFLGLALAEKMAAAPAAPTTSPCVTPSSETSTPT